MKSLNTGRVFKGVLLLILSTAFFVGTCLHTFGFFTLIIGSIFLVAAFDQWMGQKDSGHLHS